MSSERDSQFPKKNKVKPESAGQDSLAASSTNANLPGAEGEDDGDTVIHEEEKTFVHVMADEKDSVSAFAAPTPPVDSAYLQIFSGGVAGKIFPVDQNADAVLVLGRSPECQVVLEDGSVSRFHAEIRRSNENFTISDLGSSNGTLVDGNLISQSHVLRNGAEIGVGIYQFFFNNPLENSEKMPSQLPAIVEKEAIPKVSSESQVNKPAEPPTRLSTLLITFGVIIALASMLMVFGLRKIMQEESFSIQTAWTDLFGGNEGPRLAYPLVEVKTEPIPGEIFFQGEVFGRSPLEVKLTDGVQPNVDLELRAEFDLPVLEEKVVVAQMVQFNRDQELAPFLIEAPIGQIHVKKIPNDTTLLLEYTPLEVTAQTETKIRQPKVDYREPFFVPYGNYKIELRLREEFRYRRKFTLDSMNRFMPFEVTEEDLTYAPLSLETIPSGASVILDGVMLEQQTPLKDFRLPLGNHTIILRKENHQDYVLQELPTPLQVNEILSYTISLPISPVGEKILQAKKEYDLGLWKQMEATLYRALKQDVQPTAVERAEIQFLFGQVYLKLNDLRQALIYFRKTREFVDGEGKKPFENKGKLGEARVYLAQNENGKALKHAVEVFFSTDNALDKTAAESVFRQVSPIKSVIYVDTIPAGAAIFLNGRKVQTSVGGKTKDALTPLILPDLVDGQYDILLVKPGFQDSKQRVRITVSDLKALRVRLDPN